MKVSKKTRYGLRLMVALARNYSCGPLPLSEIAKKEDISGKFLAQVILLLKTGAPVISVRGPKGGYLLSKSPSEITVKSILDLFEAPFGLVECVSDASVCDKGQDCPSRTVWVKIEETINAALMSLTLADLVPESRERQKWIERAGD